MEHRRDIDGLRAAAILPVLFFHAGVPGFGGGFVGVDVFFVISGYLITGIIAREVDAGAFSLIGFYERRARRIMPALLTMIAGVLIATAFLYLPKDFAAMPRAAAAAILFWSNIHFFLDTGYFSGGAETKPLLHCWSLAVEEQFYLFFPILVIAIKRFAAAPRTPILLLLALFSFGLAVATQGSGSGFAFYLLPPRAWELFAGGLVALGAVPALRAGATREVAALAGLAAIALSVVLLDRNNVFPGVNALWPVLGAAMLIHAGPDTAAARLLARPPLVAIGLISYSLYLWHWPLVVFTRYATDAPLDGWTSALVIAASFALAALSWRFIERPFRDRARLSRRAVFLSVGMGMAVLGAVAGAMAMARGWPARFSPETLRLAAAADDISPDRHRCHDEGPCAIGNGPPAGLLWGDSHGVELARALAERGVPLIELTRSSCPPVIDYQPLNTPGCATANRAAAVFIRDHPALRTIYLAGLWANPHFAAPDFATALDRTIAALAAEGRRVVLVGPVPVNDQDVPRRLAHLARAGRLDKAAGVPRASLERTMRWLAPVEAKWRARGVAVVNPADIFCRGARCDLMRDGRPLYFDSHHPSMAGARLIAADLP